MELPFSCWEEHTNAYAPIMVNSSRSAAQVEAVRMRQRLLLDTPVCLVVQKPGNVLLVNARFRNISVDGVAVFAGVELAIDSDVQIEFTPPFGKGPLRVRAVVRNRREYVYGLEFIPRDRGEEETLQTLKALLLPAGTEGRGTLDDRRWP
jgi:hypothetical protein